MHRVPVLPYASCLFPLCFIEVYQTVSLHEDAIRRSLSNAMFSNIHVFFFQAFDYFVLVADMKNGSLIRSLLKMDEAVKVTSHKGERRKEYNITFKVKAVNFSEANSVRSAAKKFKADKKRVREWKQDKCQLTD